MNELKKQLSDLYNSDSLDEKKKIKDEILSNKEYEINRITKDNIRHHISAFKMTGEKFPIII